MKFYYCIKNSHNFKQIHTQNPYNNFKWNKNTTRERNVPTVHRKVERVHNSSALTTRT